MNIQGISSLLVALAWFAVIALIALVAVRASRGQPIKGGGRIVLVVAVVAVALTTLSYGLVFINPQERGVVVSAVSPQGYRSQPLEPGLRWIIPFAENVVHYPISRQIYTMSTVTQDGMIQNDDSVTARTSDGQEIFIDASIIYQIDPAKVVQLHLAWQNRYANELVRPQARGIIRDTVSQYRVDEVISSERFDMVSTMTQKMAEKLAENDLILIDFVLRNVTFSQEYAASVEQKQIAEQQAQQARFVVESKKQEAEQARQIAEGAADAAVIRAKGAAEARLLEAEAEAKALELIAAALRDNPDLLNYQYITKLSPNLQMMLVPSDSPFLLPFPGSTNPQNPPSMPVPEPAPQPTAVPEPAP